MRKKRAWILLIPAALAAAAITALALPVQITGPLFFRSRGSTFSIPQLDLSRRPASLPAELAYLFEQTIVDRDAEYLAHPDSVLLRNGDIFTAYPAGHGKGAIRTMLSRDGGATYEHNPCATPESWQTSRETPTVYRLTFADEGANDQLILISANPKWPGESTQGGFQCSLSADEGQSWTEFSLFYPKNEADGVVPIVAMASLTRLKEDGVFVDKWMGLFHDAAFRNYQSILSFDEAGKMQWSKPVEYMKAYDRQIRSAQMCEVEVIRSGRGTGGSLCLLARSNSKRCNSLISFSEDEGKTWSKPKEVPAALNGERHKAEYADDGRLVIVFRSIERDAEGLKRHTSGKRFYSNGPVAWVGTYEDLQAGREGQYRVKLAHTYLPGQTGPEASANADTGYCGNVALSANTFSVTTYGCFSPEQTYTDASGAEHLRTYIISKQFALDDLDRLAKLFAAS